MRRFLRIVLLMGMILCISMAGSLPNHSWDREIAVSAEDVSEDHVTRFLVMGKDRAANLTDTIFVVSINESKCQVSILQIPRDTYANYTEKRYKKLNGALNELGESGVKGFFSQILGVPIHYFVILDLSCLSHMVDAVGGIEIDVPQEMYYSDPEQNLEIRLPAGRQILNGETAEQFVRFRAGYANADLGRLDAQKLFLRAFAEKCRSIRVWQLLSLTGVVLTRLQTDIGLPEAIRTVSILRKCDPAEMPMKTLSGEAVQGSSGAWYYVVNREGACEDVNRYLMPQEPLTTDRFDPLAVLDRPEHSEFHNIYTAPMDKPPSSA